jgi:hypothetical protein
MNNKFMGLFLGIKMLQDNESKIPSSAQNEVKTKVFAINLINTENVFLNYFLTDKIIKDSIPDSITKHSMPIILENKCCNNLVKDTERITNELQGIKEAISTNICSIKLCEPIINAVNKIESTLDSNQKLKETIEESLSSLVDLQSNHNNKLENVAASINSLVIVKSKHNDMLEKSFTYLKNKDLEFEKSKLANDTTKVNNEELDVKEVIEKKNTDKSSKK